MAQNPVVTDFPASVYAFSRAVRMILPVRKVFLYGSYARGQAGADSDIDIGVVIDQQPGFTRIDAGVALFHCAADIDAKIEPRCIFTHEYEHPPSASILEALLKTAVDLPER
jgi:hypothetical protein